MKTEIKKIAVITVAVVGLIFALFPKKESYTVEVDGALNTVSSVTVIGKNAEKTAMVCAELIRERDDMFSVTKAVSEVYKINNSDSEVEVSEETFGIIKRCESFFNDTDGKFDITLGMLFDLWNDTIKKSVLPDADEINRAKSISVL